MNESPSLHHARVNGIDLHHARSGDGPLILFVHGYPRHWYLWRHQLREFGRDHTAVAVDLRGYNLSSKPGSDLDYGVWLAVEDLRALADHLGHERFVLVGHDWGAAIAWSFALHHPDRLDGLVVMSGTHPALLDRELRENAEFRQRAQVTFGLRVPEGPALASANDFEPLRAATLDYPFLSDDDRAAYLDAWRQPGAARSMLGLDRREGLGPATEDGTPARGNYVPEVISLRVEVPTLVMYTTDDPYGHPGCFRGLEEYVPDVTVQELPGTHWLPEEQPDVVNAAIRAFLAARAVPATTAA